MHMHKHSLFASSLSLLFFPVSALAAAWTLGNPAPGAGTTLKDFIYLLLDILKLVVIPALAFSIIYGGFLLVSAGGDETQVTKAKQWILWSLVGGAIILGANVIADMAFATAAQF
jgi:Type IV secretion system pilin